MANDFNIITYNQRFFHIKGDLWIYIIESGIFRTCKIYAFRKHIISNFCEFGKTRGPTNTVDLEKAEYSIIPIEFGMINDSLNLMHR